MSDEYKDICRCGNSDYTAKKPTAFLGTNERTSLWPICDAEVLNPFYASCPTYRVQYEQYCIHCARKLVSIEEHEGIPTLEIQNLSR
jgi:hypothetical protein